MTSFANQSLAAHPDGANPFASGTDCCEFHKTHCHETVSVDLAQSSIPTMARAPAPIRSRSDLAHRFRLSIVACFPNHRAHLDGANPFSSDRLGPGDAATRCCRWVCVLASPAKFAPECARTDPELQRFRIRTLLFSRPPRSGRPALGEGRSRALSLGSAPQRNEPISGRNAIGRVVSNCHLQQKVMSNLLGRSPAAHPALPEPSTRSSRSHQERSWLGGDTRPRSITSAIAEWRLG